MWCCINAIACNTLIENYLTQTNAQKLSICRVAKNQTYLRNLNKTTKNNKIFQINKELQSWQETANWPAFKVFVSSSHREIAVAQSDINFENIARLRQYAAILLFCYEWF